MRVVCCFQLRSAKHGLPNSDSGMVVSETVSEAPPAKAHKSVEGQCSNRRPLGIIGGTNGAAVASPLRMEGVQRACE